MKKILLFIGVIIVMVSLLTINLSLDTVHNKMHLTQIKSVKAEYGWEMNENAPCPNGGTYKRCEQVPYSSNCNVYDQTFCGEPE